MTNSRTIIIVAAIIGGCVLVTVCIAIGIIAFLALMGPAVGNVYSNLTPVP